MRRLLRIVFWFVAGLYIFAFTFFVVGWFGLFGMTHDPLAGVFLIPLGLPWNFAGDYFPLGVQPYISIFAPLINLGILHLISR